MWLTECALLPKVMSDCADERESHYHLPRPALSEAERLNKSIFSRPLCALRSVRACGSAVLDLSSLTRGSANRRSHDPPNLGSCDETYTLLFDQFVRAQNCINFFVSSGRVATFHGIASGNQESRDFGVISSWFTAVSSAVMQPAGRCRMEGMVFHIERCVAVDQQLGEIRVALPARPVQGGGAVLAAGVDRQTRCE